MKVPEDTRDSLNITSKYNIDVTARIVPHTVQVGDNSMGSSSLAEAPAPKKAKINITGLEGEFRNSSITCRVVRRRPIRSSEKPPKFTLTVNTKGSLTVYIPHSFNGPIFATSYYTARLSPSVRERTVELATGGMMKGFIGDGDYMQYDPAGQWDELRLFSYAGSIRIYYGDEPDEGEGEGEEDEEGGNGGLWSIWKTYLEPYLPKLKLC